MQGDPYSAAFPGLNASKIPHQAWNSILDATRGDFGDVGNIRTRIGIPSAHIVTIKNNSGSNVSQFGILGISGVIITPSSNQSLFNQRVLLTGTSPTLATYFSKFAVCQHPIASGKLGRAYIMGICPAKVNIVTANDPYCDVKDADLTQLKSSAFGSARILYGNGSTGTQSCVIGLGMGYQPGQTFRVKLTSDGTGSNGNKTTSCSLKYLVDPYGGSSSTGTLSSSAGLAPDWAGRPDLGYMNAATEGLATFDSAGAPKLVVAFEQRKTSNCP